MTPKLRRLRLDGSADRTLSHLDPKTLHDLVSALDPALHSALELSSHDQRATVWPVTHAEGGLGTVVTRLEHAGTVRWLGQAAVGPDVVVGGATRPAHAVVPASWAASFLSALVMPGEAQPLLAYLPWHDASFAPMGAWRATHASHASLCAAPDRTVRLRALAEEIRGVLQAVGLEVGKGPVIAELRRVGHDLWHHEYDGEVDTWAWDYMRVAPGRGLHLAVRHRLPVAVRCTWVDDWHDDMPEPPDPSIW